jgi:hypothetical protein
VILFPKQATQKGQFSKITVNNNLDLILRPEYLWMDRPDNQG